MLTVNAENVMTTVLKAAETAAVRIPPKGNAQFIGLTWVKKCLTDNLLF